MPGERKKHGGLATEATVSTNCGSRQRLEESCCWGLFPPQEFLGRWALKCSPFLGSWVQLLCRHRKLTERLGTSCGVYILHDEETEATEAESLCQGGHMFVGRSRELQGEGTG